jgi:SAM-dependent methyltransferase
LSPTSSSYRVQYDLRPAKQVERRMIVDALLRLAAAGFPIREYQYTGFGSIYFVDFILFHKLLGLDKLVSLEREKSLAARVYFNRPFSCVEVKMAPASSELPNLSRDVLHIVWLDYDGILHRDFLSDIQSALTVLKPGSIVLVTVDLEPPESHDYQAIDPDFDESKEVLGPKHWKRYFECHASNYLGIGLTEEDFGKSKLGLRATEILSAAFTRSIIPRREVQFLPMFNFVYRDTHSMLTMGGMIGSRAEKRQLRASTIDETVYYRDRFDISPFEIRVPRLTRKERMYLDREMPCADGWVPAEFDLGLEETLRYRDLYRFLPAFAELLL